ncbi:MAG: L-aspartate oxidase [Prevotellaceae bacterium]|jgi:L-aspartate oxidase|nr:L-aspartate oxidase [Prevotellaceae bacterium]
MQKRFDFLVVGSGIAGMSYALKVAHKGRVAIVCKTTLDEANTALAQGGISSVTNTVLDNYEKHIQDTLVAGDGMCNLDAVEKVVTGAPLQIAQLLDWGVDFDKTPDGSFDLHREGGHSEYRILHHKDSTGAEIQQSLIARIRNHPNIEVFEYHFAIDLLTQHHLGQVVTRRTPDITCYGIYALDVRSRHILTMLGKVTMLATGGIGNIYHTTTNPPVATGDGIAMVHRARGLIRDMEFVQFHPTAFYYAGKRPSFLITEALRGYGGVLRTLGGEAFMQRYDYRGSLAPRDIVARAIDTEMKLSGSDYVYLDVTGEDPETTKAHFPTIYQTCLACGIDITKEYIPVAPAAHYLCGGIVVDTDGKTSIHRLYAAGECACTGLHGANRLASNSLIEAIVYADAAAQHSIACIENCDFRNDIPEWNDDGTSHPEELVLITQSLKEVQQIMSSYVGIVRSNLRLKRAMSRLEILFRETENLFNCSVVSRELCELRNCISVAYLVIKQATARQESRGLHYNIDYP